MQQKRQLVCNVCGTKLSGETVVNMSLFSSDVNLAKKFREDFFYHAFGPAKTNNDINIVPENASVLKDIDRHYEKGSTKFNPVSIIDDSIRIHFKTTNKNINQNSNTNENKKINNKRGSEYKEQLEKLKDKNYIK